MQKVESSAADCLNSLFVTSFVVCSNSSFAIFGSDRLYI